MRAVVVELRVFCVPKNNQDDVVFLFLFVYKPLFLQK